MKHIILTLILLLGVFAARAENIVSVSSASGHPQDEVTLNVSLANTDAAVAFQAEIPLGSQLTYVAGSAMLNAERITDHQVSAAVVGGSLRIYAFSLSLTPFLGNEGTLLSFTLRLKTEPGNYPLDITNSILSNAYSTSIPLSTINGQVTILSPKLQINTPTINYGHVPIRSEYTQNVQLSNVGNEPLTLSGVTFSDAVFSCPNFTEVTLQPGVSTSFTFRFAPMVKGAVTATATIVSNSISGNSIINLVADPFAVNEIHVGNTMGYCDSIVEVPISMNNMEGIIGFQIEFDLNSALEFVDFTLSDRNTNHVSTGVVVGTTLRLMAYSPSGAAFTGDDGVIGTVRFLLRGLYGYYSLYPTKAVLADANGEDVLSDKYEGYVDIRSPQIYGDETLNFGSSPVTETVSREYVVNNWGNASMRIDQVVFDQEGFAVTETLPIIVGEWESSVLHVSYSREQKGDFNALMKIYSNDPQNGLKNVALSGNRYEPNSLELSAEVLETETVEVSLTMHNYSDIVALQVDFSYPHQDYSVSSSDFQLTDRFANHFLFTTPLNDSTFRIIVLSMQNNTVEGHEGVVLNITLHPIGTLEAEEYTVSVSNIVLSGREGTNLFTGEDTSIAFSLMKTQSVQLSQGWNWWSSNVEIGLDELKAALIDALPGTNITIKSKNNGSTTYNGTTWRGQLNTLNVAQMYRISVSTDCEITLEGFRINPAERPITISYGANWIAFPFSQSMTVSNAFAGFAVSGDVVKSKNDGIATYNGTQWRGTLNTLVPGQGYIYKSNVQGDRNFTFPASTK